MIAGIKDVLKKTPFYGLYKNKKRQKPQFEDSDQQIIYVHIGKCGGASLWRAINESTVLKDRFARIGKVHIVRPPFLNNANYLIVVRNPIKRALSAFNWRYKLVVEDAEQKDRFPGEYDVLNKYTSLNALAESLYEGEVLNEAAAKDFRMIHHLREDIAFYIGSLVNKVRKDQIFGVLATETLDDDISRILGVPKVEKVHENSSQMKSEKMHLSETAYNNLRLFLKDDYTAIEKLLELHEMDPAQRDMLLT